MLSSNQIQQLSSKNIHVHTILTRYHYIVEAHGFRGVASAKIKLMNFSQ